MKKLLQLSFMLLLLCGVSMAQKTKILTALSESVESTGGNSSVGLLGVTPNDAPMASTSAIVLPTDGGTSQNSRAPSNYFKYQRTEYLITPAEMATSGLVTSTAIDAIGFLVQAAGVGTLSGTLNIYLKNTSDATYTLGSTWTTTGFTQVSTNATYTIPINANYFLIPFTGGSTFTYTGGGVYVAWEYSSPSGTIGSTPVTHYCNSTGLVNGLYGGRGTSMPTTLAASSFRPATFFSTVPETDIINITNLYPAGKVPTPFGTPSPISVRVANVSDVSSATYDLTVTVQDAVTYVTRYTSTQSGITLAAGTVGTTTFNGWTPTISENVIIFATATPAAGETYTLNNSSLTYSCNVNTNLFSYNYSTASPPTGYGFTAPGYAIFASKFTMNGAGQIPGANLVIANSSTITGNSISAVVLNSAGVIVATSASYTLLATDVGLTKNFTFPTPPAFTNEVFYVGMLTSSAATTYYPMGMFNEIPSRGGINYTFPATGGTPTETVFNYRYGIEAQVAPVAGVVNPGALSVTPVSTTQINLGWSLNPSNENVLLAWSTDGVFGTPVNGTAYVAGNTIVGGGTVLQYNNSTSFSHTGLAPGTHYYYKIWSGNGTAFSSGVAGNAFTICNSSAAPWTENFELATFPPSCWTKSASPTWLRSSACSGYGVGTASAKADFFNISSAVPFDLVSLPYTSGSLVSPILKFDYAYAGYDDTGGPYIDKLDIYYSTNNGVSYTLLLDMPGGLTGILNTYGPTSLATAFVPTSAQWASQTLALPAGTNYIKFTATSAYGNNLYLDNVSVQEAPLCNVPTALNTSAVTQTTATISWTASSSNPSGGYQYEVRTSGAGGSGTTGLVLSGTTPAGVVTANLTGLTAATSYSLYVRSNCGSGSFSAWAGPSSFTTLCATATTPFIETFEVGEMHPCWTISGGTYNWQLVSGTGLSGYGNGSRAFYANFFNISSGSQFQLYTPEFNSGTLSNPTLEFDYAYATYSGELDEMDVYYSTNGGLTYSLLLAMPGGATGILNTGGTTTSQFVPTASQWATKALPLPAGTNKVEFRAISDFGNNLFLDNIKIKEATTTFNVDMSTAAGFTPGTDVVYLTGNFPGATWITPGDPGSMVMSQVGSSLIYTRTLALAPGTYEYKYFKNSGWSGGEYAGGANRSITVTTTTTVNNTWGGSINWANLQWPGTGSITVGGAYDVYAQAYIAGVTSVAGATYGLQAWIGYSTSNTDPSTWTNWIPAPFFGQAYDNDEFKVDLGSTLPVGTYYYASRFQFGSQPFLYGGFSGTNGGFWDGTNNISGVLTISAVTTKTLNLKVYLESLYNVGTGFMNQALGAGSAPEFGSGIADVVTVELHNQASPFDLAHTFSNVNLMTNGTLSVTTVPGSISGSYYVVIKHRNSIETWSAAPVSFGVPSPVSYDFTTGISQAYGDNLKSMGTIYSIFGGDATQDGIVDGSDMAAIDNASTSILTGYVVEDVNGDGVVDGSDMALIDNNATSVISVKRP